jgi:lipoyl(octanoyl) transferase
VDLLVLQLGRVDYREALALQFELRERVQAGGPEVLLLLEHPLVYTLGRRSEPSDLPMGQDWYRAQGFDIVEVQRGGKLTHHGPGQLVGYPIVRVERIPDYIQALEAALVDALAQENVEGRGRDHEGPQFTGVWVEDRKIASIGVHVSHGVSMHGFALNVDNDLQPFEWAVACGMPETRMTSVCKETGRAGLMPCMRKRVAFAVCEALGCRQRIVTQYSRRLDPAARHPISG